MDDATNEHYSMFFVDEEGTMSSFRGTSMVLWPSSMDPVNWPIMTLVEN